jgi:hypothetical protein
MSGAKKEEMLNVNFSDWVTKTLSKTQIETATRIHLEREAQNKKINELEKSNLTCICGQTDYMLTTKIVNVETKEARHFFFCKQCAFRSEIKGRRLSGWDKGKRPDNEKERQETFKEVKSSAIRI